jgi:hypothetical protein
MAQKAQETATVEVVEQVEEREFKRCACNCGQIVNPKRSFAQGHDARHKGNLLKLWDAGQGAMAEELVDRGWYTWEQLEARRDKATEKAEAKAKREEAKQQRAAEKAEAKPAKTTESEAA